MFKHMFYGNLPRPLRIIDRGHLAMWVVGGSIMVGAIGFFGLNPSWHIPVIAYMLVVGVIWNRKRKQFLSRVRDLDGTNVCLYCAHNLTGSPDEGTCPECGTSYIKDDNGQKWAFVHPELSPHRAFAVRR